jgi:AraC-like DNA-binding protein
MKVQGSGHTALEAQANGRQSPVPFGRAGGLAPLIRLLHAMGAPVQALLANAGIPAALLDDPENLIPVHLVYRFAEAAASSQGLPDLGVLLGARMSAFEIPTLGPVLRRSITVYDYLQTASRMIGALSTGERFWLTLENDEVRFHHYVPGRQRPGRCHEDLYCLVVTINMLRRFADDPGWSPREVAVMANDSAMLGDGSVFGDAEIHLGQSHSSFTLPASLLQEPIRAGVPGCASRGAGMKSPSVPALPSEFLESIDVLVTSLLLAESLDVKLVAEAAGVSERTLQRRLKDCGLSYSQVVQHARIRLARDWLERTSMSVGTIAATLGYTDPANFTRAFRRSTGIPPRQYRASLS